MISKHLKNCLEGNFKEAQEGEAEPADPADGIKLELNAEILEICIKFLHYKVINRQVSFERPPFPIEPEVALKVLEASIYL